MIIPIAPITLILPSNAAVDFIDLLRSATNVPIGEYKIEVIGCVEWQNTGYSGQISLRFDANSNGLSTSWIKGRYYNASGVNDAGGPQKLDEIGLSPSPNDAASIVPFILQGKALFTVANDLGIQVFAPNLDTSDPVKIVIAMLLVSQ